MQSEIDALAEIERLSEELDEMGKSYWEEIQAIEARLAKAIEALEWYATESDVPKTHHRAVHTLAAIRVPSADD